MSMPTGKTVTLEELAWEFNRELETTAQAYSERAFNLGCSIAMLPAAVVLVITFFLSRANWALTAIVAVLVGFAAVGLAAFAATVARRSAVERVYNQQVSLWLPPRLEEAEADWGAFVETVQVTLHEDAPLRLYIDKSPEKSEQDTI